MSKILMKIVLAFSIVLASSAFFYYYDYTDSRRLEEIDKTPFAISFYLDETAVSTDEVLQKFTELSQTYQVSLEKITTEYVNDTQQTVFSGVFCENTYPISQLALVEGSFPKDTHSFLASYATQKPEQCGTLYDFAGNDCVLIQSLDTYYATKGRIAGTYQITSQEAFNTPEVLNEIGTFFGMDTETLLHKSVYKESITATFPVLLGALVLTLLIFSLVIIVIPVSHMKEIGIQKLIGWSNYDIGKAFLKGVPLTAGITIFVLVLAFFFLIRNNNFSFMLSLLGIQTAVLLCLLLLSSAALFIIRSFKTGDIIKQSVSMKAPLLFAYVLKIAFLLFLVVFASQVAPNFEKVLHDYQSQQQWINYKQYSVISSVKLSSEDIDSVSSGDARFEEKFGKLYPLLNRKYEGLYVTGSDYPSLPPSEDPLKSYQKMTVNLNCLKAFPLYDREGNPISFSEDTAHRIILIPQSREADAAQLAKFEQEAAARYQRSAEERKERKGSTANKTNLTFDEVEVVLYQDDKPFFSFNDHVAQNTNYELKSPVISVITESNILDGEGWNLAVSGVNAPMKLKVNEESAAELITFFDSGEFADNAIKIDTLTNCVAADIFYAQNALLAMMLVLIIIFIVSILASFFLFSVLILSRKKLLYVEKLQGLSLFYRFRNEIIVFSTLYLLAILASYLITHSFIAFLLIAGIIALDILISLALIRYLETRNTAQQLKGV